MEPKMYLHTKIRTSTYTRLLTFMAENNLQALGAVVDAMFNDCLNVARVNAENKRRKEK